MQTNFLVNYFIAFLIFFDRGATFWKGLISWVIRYQMVSPHNLSPFISDTHECHDLRKLGLRKIRTSVMDLRKSGIHNARIKIDS